MSHGGAGNRADTNKRKAFSFNQDIHMKKMHCTPWMANFHYVLGLFRHPHQALNINPLLLGKLENVTLIET